MFSADVVRLPVWASLFGVALALSVTAAEARPLFVCEIGAKRVEIAKESGNFVYRYGNRAHTELTIVGDPAKGAIFRLTMSYDGEAHQLRFVKGDLSYAVYVMSGNPAVDGKAIAGLIVRRGAATISDEACSHANGAFFLDPEYETLPVDAEAFGPS